MENVKKPSKWYRINILFWRFFITIVFFKKKWYYLTKVMINLSSLKTLDSK